MKTLMYAGALISAALLEVGGDALIRKGIQGGGGLTRAALGALALAAYGVVINLVPAIDFSRLLGGYVAVFAVVSVLCGMVFFQEKISITTSLGLAVVMVGACLIQWGSA